jgi:hypothetical protein
MTTRIYGEVTDDEKQFVERVQSQLGGISQKEVVALMIRYASERYFDEPTDDSFYDWAWDQIAIHTESGSVDPDTDLNAGARAKNADDLPEGVDPEFHTEQQEEMTLEDLEAEIENLGEKE